MSSGPYGPIFLSRYMQVLIFLNQKHLDMHERNMPYAVSLTLARNDTDRNVMTLLSFDLIVGQKQHSVSESNIKSALQY